MISSPYIVNGLKGEVERHNHCQPKKLVRLIVFVPSWHLLHVPQASQSVRRSIVSLCGTTIIFNFIYYNKITVINERLAENLYRLTEKANLNEKEIEELKNKIIQLENNLRTKIERYYLIKKDCWSGEMYLIQWIYNK